MRRLRSGTQWPGYSGCATEIRRKRPLNASLCTFGVSTVSLIGALRFSVNGAQYTSQAAFESVPYSAQPPPLEGAPCTAYSPSPKLSQTHNMRTVLRSFSDETKSRASSPQPCQGGVKSFECCFSWCQGQVDVPEINLLLPFSHPPPHPPTPG